MLMENSIYIIGDIYRYIYFETYKDKPHIGMYYMWNHIYLILENSIYMLETYIYLSYILYVEHVIHGEANHISTYIICRAYIQYCSTYSETNSSYIRILVEVIEK